MRTDQPPILSEIATGLGLSLAQAARRFPPARMGRPVSPSCVWRWIHDGITLPNGTVVHLEGARLAGRWLTSEPAIERFLAGQTPDADPAPSTIRTPTQRRKASERAARELDRIGI
jgi:hypothetical protein